MEKNIGHQLKVNTNTLLQEILNNPGTKVLEKPFAIFFKILAQVASRATELNDKELNKLMMRLALYSISDPNDPDYDEDFVSKYLDS